MKRIKIALAIGYLGSLMLLFLVGAGISLYREGILWPFLGIILAMAGTAWSFHVLLDGSTK